MINPTEYHLMDEILARLVDAKVAGMPVTLEQLALVIKLQRDLHEHTIAQRWDDDQDVAYCTVCGDSWGTTRHELIATFEREDGITWPIWACFCGCGHYSSRWSA
jgi:hypothetical protein